MSFFSPSPATSTTTPLFAPEASQVFGLEQSLLSQFLLPFEAQNILGLGSLSQGDLSRAPQLVGPAMSAGRQAQATFGAMSADLPANLRAPMQEGFANQVGQIPRQLETLAPSQLAPLVQDLIGRSYGGLFAPGSQTLSQTGGPSDVGQGLALGQTVLQVLAGLGKLLSN